MTATAAATTAASIEISGLTRHFGALKAVDGVSFGVRSGEVLGFLGPNGAGKSTTMKMVTGFLAPTAGRITVCGHDVASRPREAKRLLGYLPEGAPAYPDMTPAGLLAFVGRIRGLTGAAYRSRLEEVVEQVHLGGVMHQRIETLSKGYKRRVGLAQAILHDPPVLILDEPTDGLDPNQKHEVRELIRRMAPRKVIVLSTHILEEVHAVCTRAVIISRGRVVMDGTPAELEARGRTHQAVVVALRDAPADAPDLLRALPGVRGVEALEGEDGRRAWRVLPARGATVVEGVAGLVRERGWALQELHTERGRLDDVFREITGSGAAPGPAGAGGGEARS